ncbi:putative inorganic pyrophosphatase [Phascolomyces articulosus]|uniref:inorganic diphosphatase n=1 Tax=Phascolomyces articulosus TaxID=60185 RepID=A0AAD5PFL8_9FUNG|nr:putative inorganic pyrophosphatase [Phascolomyces articulosus]
MLLTKITTVALACTVVSASLDLDIPSLLDLGNSDHHNTNGEKRCADVDCLYRIRTTGALHTRDYALYLENDQGVPISIFHDLPFQPASRKEPHIFNMIVEIPRWTLPKMETTKESVMNPIKQDTLKDGSLRYLPNMFPTKGQITNYGAIQQTYEDPHHLDPESHTKGDNDPIDVVELSEIPGFIGEVKQVKVLGGLCLIDEGALDWKVITIDVHDPMAQYLNNMDDVEQHYPGLAEEVRTWFRTYKIPSSGHVNTFGFGSQYVDKDYMISVIYQTHEFWKELIDGRITDKKTNKGTIQTATLTNTDSPYKVDANSPEVQSIPENDPQEPKPIPKKYLEWSFVPSQEN